MFMAMPWIPVGSPKRKSERMIPRSGAMSMPRRKWITEPGANSRHTPYTVTSVLLAIVPSAAPTVPSLGISRTLKRMVSAVIADAEPQRRPRRRPRRERRRSA